MGHDAAALSPETASWTKSIRSKFERPFWFKTLQVPCFTVQVNLDPGTKSIKLTVNLEIGATNPGCYPAAGGGDGQRRA